MAEVVARHQMLSAGRTGLYACTDTECGWELKYQSQRRMDELMRGADVVTREFAAHVAEQLAANGYGKLEDAWDEGHVRGFWNGRLSQLTSYDAPDPLIGAADAKANNPYRRPE